MRGPPRLLLQYPLRKAIRSRPMTLFNPVFHCLTPIVTKRSKTQADEGLTSADEAGSVVLRQPPASKLANLFRIDVRDHALISAAQRSSSDKLNDVLSTLNKAIFQPSLPIFWPPPNFSANRNCMSSSHHIRKFSQVNCCRGRNAILPPYPAAGCQRSTATAVPGASRKASSVSSWKPPA